MVWECYQSAIWIRQLLDIDIPHWILTLQQSWTKRNTKSELSLMKPLIPRWGPAVSNFCNKKIDARPRFLPRCKAGSIRIDES